MKKIRMGVIGTAGISSVHISGILKSPDAELAALCDVDEKSLDQSGKKYGISKENQFKDYRELLKSPEVDAVSICTPNDSHFEIAMEAVRNHKPFALEKPVTLSYKEAKLLKEAASSINLPNMVCFSYRFKAAARYARWIIQQGYLGRIFHVYGQYLQSWGIDEDVPLVWRFKKELAGSGALGDLGSHMIDLTRFLVGDFQRVCGHAGTYITKRKIPGTDRSGDVDVDDYCHFMAELQEGISASFAISRFAFGRGNYQRVEVYGAKGGLIYGLEDEDTIEICIGDLYGDARDYHKVPVPQRFRCDQMQSFFDLINGKWDGLAATMEDGCINQLLVDSIIKSFESKEWITL